ncbi:hypothetical protein SCP_1700140 [Sparassis crispa]|uniref:Uncharacterized protein n=1 Tax=Sparassis crispa TaxID=139825 RepID=A0A401H5R4_9APHY|nr:hypothetical protein SCP_1700140 [Sparassis crispa]GBE89690.1 hypothetical protein SCP_1700140 [Sparassis crispa]
MVAAFRACASGGATTVDILRSQAIKLSSDLARVLRWRPQAVTLVTSSFLTKIVQTRLADPSQTRARRALESRNAA